MKSWQRLDATRAVFAWSWLQTQLLTPGDTQWKKINLHVYFYFHFFFFPFKKNRRLLKVVLCLNDANEGVICKCFLLVLHYIEKRKKRCVSRFGNSQHAIKSMNSFMLTVNINLCAAVKRPPCLPFLNEHSVTCWQVCVRPIMFAARPSHTRWTEREE